MKKKLSILFFIFILISYLSWVSHSAAVVVFAVWVLVPLLVGWIAFTRRDA